MWEWVERFDAEVGAVKASRNETPEILAAVCMDRSERVLDHVINKVLELIQSFIRLQRVVVDR